MRPALSQCGSLLFSLTAGMASFLFTLAGFVMLVSLGEQVAAAAGIGLFALTVVWIASERPNAAQARANRELVNRLLAVKTGDLHSPAPAAVRAEMPGVAAAVDSLFEQVRSNLDDVAALALYDPVTALPNRIHFGHEAERLLAEGAAPMALLFVDLDGFKEVNDRLGHAQGDKLLAIVATRLRVVLNTETRADAPAPVLARLAGDEFTMLLPGAATREEAARIARKALAVISAPYDVGGRRVRIGASIGIAISPDDGTELPDLMRAADIAMYDAKAGGGGSATNFRPELAAAFDLRSEILPFPKTA